MFDDPQEVLPNPDSPNKSNKSLRLLGCLGGILYASLDLGEVVRSKLDFDVVGHYARPDVFKFTAAPLQAKRTEADPPTCFLLTAVTPRLWVDFFCC